MYEFIFFINIFINKLSHPYLNVTIKCYFTRSNKISAIFKT